MNKVRDFKTSDEMRAMNPWRKNVIRRIRLEAQAKESGARGRVAKWMLGKTKVL